MERLRERLEQAAVALATLEEVLHEPPSAIVRDASIQRFEYSFAALSFADFMALNDALELEYYT